MGGKSALAPAVKAWLGTADNLLPLHDAKLYVVEVALIIILASFIAARSQANRLEELRPYRGRRPTTPEAAEAQLGRLDEFESDRRRTVTRYLGYLTLSGFVVPSIIFGLSLFYYSWLFPGRHALGLPCGGAALQASELNVGTFVLSQLAMGVLGLVGEVTSIPFLKVGLTYVPADKWAAILLAVYRYFVGGFFAVFGRMFLIAIGVSRDKSIDARRAELQEELGGLR